MRVYPEHSGEMFSFGFELMEDFVEAAEKDGLLIDMSKHDGCFESLPFNLDFKIIRKV